MIRCRWGMRGFALFVVGLLGLNLAAQPYNPAGQAQWRRSVASQAAFAFNLYRVLDEDAPEGNLLYSPYSLYLALSMTYEGARGNTAAEMVKILFNEGGYDEGLRSATLASFRDIAQRTAEGAGSGAVLRSASRLYGDGSYGYNQATLDALAQLYGAPFGLVDFARDSAGARAAINQWVSEQTHGQVAELLPQGAVTPLTRLVLANALYLGGQWKDTEKFLAGDTQNQPFTRLDGGQVSVPLMSQAAKNRLYYAGANYQAVFLPLGDSGLGLLALLPAEGQWEALEQAMNAAWYLELMDGLAMQAVTLFLPRWESRQALSAREALQRLGMVDAFDDARADLSGFSVTGESPLTISAVLHQAALKLDEDGVEASAATAVIASVRSAPPSVDAKRAIELRFDRPFVYAIVDRLTYAPLFVGRLVDPSVP